MRFLSVCSGIEAASVAWEPLGWRCAGLSEIEPFPRAVLEQRQGAVACGWDHRAPESGGLNYTPMFGDFTQIEADHVGSIDLLVGGTPCQDYSIAGLRAGLDGSRGNLTLEFSRLADRTRPRWLVWENVPGAFSTHEGRDFGAILATFSGRHGSVFERPATGWGSAGIVEQAGADSYGLAWRVLDAQYFGVPQRRRRVFVVGYLGDWRRAAAVLFERDSLQRHPAPRRESREVAPTIPARSLGGGGLGSDFDCEGGLVANSGDQAFCLTSAGQQSNDAETETIIAHSLRGEGFDASEDGTGRGTPLVTAFSVKDYGADAREEIAPTLRAGGHSKSHAKAGVMPAVAFDMRGREGGAMPEGPHQTANIRAASGGSSRSYIANPPSSSEAVGHHKSAVRRLTPRECERLQGFPDDYTQIGWRKKAAPDCPDGPRYKALGNSMAVPVMRWIGERIEMVEGIANHD